MDPARLRRFAVLEGGLWLPGRLPAGDARPSPSAALRGLSSRMQVIQAYARHGERVQRALAANDLLRRLFELGFPLNLRPPGILPTLPFLPLLRRSGEGVQALGTADGWALRGPPGEWDALLRQAQWTLALLGESAAQDWQAGLDLSDDDAEVEALSMLLARRKTLPLPGDHHLLMAGPLGPFLLTGPLVGARLLTTSWEVEAVRLARAAVLGAWVPLPERRMEAMYRAALTGDVQVEKAEQDWWRVWVDGTAVSLAGRDETWVVGRRSIPRRTEQPDRLTCLWAARVGAGKRARHFWRPTRTDVCLALARGQGVGLPESIAVYHLAPRLMCPACRASLVVGGACLNPACPSRRGSDDDYHGAPLVRVRGRVPVPGGGVLLYAPDRPGWVEEKDGQIRGVVGDGLLQMLSPERVLVRRASDRTALLTARLACFAEQRAPLDADLPLPSPSAEALEATRQIVQERAPFPSRFDEALRGLLV